MKMLGEILLLTILLWSPSLSAKYCKTSPTTNLISCKFSDNTGRPHDATIAISYTKQGWSMMIALFVDDWIMLEGDARIKVGDNPEQTLSYVKTHRDITSGESLMEAAVFLVSEDLLRDMQNANGSVKFWLPAKEADTQEIKFRGMRFSKLDDLIEETKTTLGLTNTDP